jgi:hypothetical protein
MSEYLLPIDRMIERNRLEKQRSDLQEHLELLCPEELATLAASMSDGGYLSSTELNLIAKVASEQCRAANELQDDETADKYRLIDKVVGTYAFWKKGDETGDRDVYYRTLSRIDEKAYRDLVSKDL